MFVVVMMGTVDCIQYDNKKFLDLYLCGIICIALSNSI